MDQAEHSALSNIERKAYDRGLVDGTSQTDHKLEECLAGIKRANDICTQLKRERDALLEEYTRVSWGKVCQSNMAAGLHPPSAHRHLDFQRKYGAFECKKCNPDLMPWDDLPTDLKKAKMDRVFSTLMQVRAKKHLNSGVSIDQAPTTHELGGTSERTE